MNQSDFAKLHNVSRKTVTSWKARGWVVSARGVIDVDASNAQLERYRKSVTQPEKSYLGNGLGNRNKLLPNDQLSVLPSAIDDESAEKTATRIMSAQGASMTLDEARRVKENYLALLHQLDYERKSGELVELAVAETILFDQARASRDAWLNWPTRIGPLVAADLGLEADRIVDTLTNYVHQHLQQLGQPENEVEFS
ncbi:MULTISPECIES: hypothetical protein [unclassified Pseudomonas]|uniref:hypothetical protein n=1 Tax=unclassified Pseudomonas TaxID=196821 RepID=UPI002AB53AB2|nr:MULTISPECIES: hypothetical protein [unclassified Pseudomonas]MDY7558972.1 hypothetical protein [Pseudomonas sp. AB6]MEA9976288.1 hypothetical protein [Pseudomonas sp. RTS4]MEB0197620.1 hypothetical protein [Pseudomonas sp. 5S4]MEB0209040.1 hypothetical protein [Pseudomonas sp. AB6]MEB0246134.1 hypothetical protein [Pseudomonas sp. 10S5]